LYIKNIKNTAPSHATHNLAKKQPKRKREPVVVDPKFRKRQERLAAILAKLPIVQ
jgi:hypothetical protein